MDVKPSIDDGAADWTAAAAAVASDDDAVSAAARAMFDDELIEDDPKEKVPPQQGDETMPSSSGAPAAAGVGQQQGPLDAEYRLRFRPKWIAPAALADYDLGTSPHRDLTLALMKIVGPPPPPEARGIGIETSHTAGVAVPPAPQQQQMMINRQMGRSGRPISVPRKPMIQTAIPPAPQPPAPDLSARGTLPSAPHQWKWMTLEEVYSKVPPPLRRELRPFRGLARFLRLHGRLFHVSSDKVHVIAHCRDGRPPPLLALASHSELQAQLQRRQGSTGARIPQTRAELLLVDPTNPLLRSQTLCEEIVKLLPDHPVSLYSLMKHLPPLMRAAMPSKPHKLVSRSPLFSTWMQSAGVFMVQKASLGPPPTGLGIRDTMSLEDAVLSVSEHIPPEGSSLIGLRNRIPPAARNTVRNFGGIDRFIASYPQYFYIDTSGHPRVFRAEDVSASADAHEWDEGNASAADEFEHR